MIKFLFTHNVFDRTNYINYDLFSENKSGNNFNNFNMLIVPDHLLFETEFNIYKNFGAVNIRKLEITTFSKKSSEILNKYSARKPYADAAVKEITMIKTLEKLNKNKSLFFYTGLPTNISSKLIDIISIFQRQGISSENFVKLTQDFLKSGESINLRKKLKDISLIYTTYSELLNENFSDRANDIYLAVELCEIYNIFKDKKVFIGSFDNFTESQFVFLKKIAEQAKDLIFLNALYKSREYFFENFIFKRIINMSKNLNKKYEIINSDNNLISGSEEKKIKINTAPDIYSEFNWCAAKIRELITQGGYSQNDIMVLSRNFKIFPQLMSSFALYGINARCDISNSLIETALARFIITALKAVKLEPDALISYIKSGFVRVSVLSGRKFLINNFNKKLVYKKLKYLKNFKISEISEISKLSKTRRLKTREISKFESAQKLWNLSGSEWRGPFPVEDKSLAFLEPFRADIVAKLCRVSEKTLDTTGDKITEVISEFFFNEMELRRSALSVYRDKNYNLENLNYIWEKIITIFETLHSELKNFPISLDDYIKLLYKIFTRTNIDKSPQMLDAAKVCGFDQVLTENIKIVFVLNANVDVFPKSVKTKGEFNSKEIELLRDLKIHIDNITERFHYEKSIINKILQISSEKLYISAPLKDLNWENLEPSPLLQELARKYKTEIDSTENEALSTRASTEKALEFLLLNYISINNKYNFNILKSAMLEINPEKASKFNFSSCEDKKNRHKVSFENLNRKLNKISVSQIETLNKCLFRYFGEHELKIAAPREINQTDLTGIQRGNLAHFCLYNILNKYINNFNFSEFINLSEENLKRSVLENIDLFAKKELLSYYARNRRQKFIINAYAEMIVKFLKHFQEEIQTTKFRPLELEKTFEYKLGRIIITGKIDRLDVMEENYKKYIKIIDYKTKNGKIDGYPMFNYGVDWQIFIYLFSVLEKNPNADPAGAYYLPCGEGAVLEKNLPYKNALNPSETELKRIWISNHRPVGFYIKDVSPAADLEAVKYSYNKYAPSSRVNYFNLEELTAEKLSEDKNFIIKTLTERLEKLYSGEITAEPIIIRGARGGEKNINCEFCQFEKICGKN